MITWIRRKLQMISEKNRIVLYNAVGAFGVKGVALVVSLFTMPAYMRFFSDRQILGVWFTVLSVLTWILNFDLGVGNGLRNKLAAALATGNRTEAKELISSAYCMIGVIVLLLSAAGWLLIPYVNWNTIFNVARDLIPVSVLQEVVRYTFVGMMLQFFLRLISSVLYAMQKSAVNNLIALITSVLQLLFVLFVPSSSPLDNLRVFSVAYVLCANAPLMITTILVFCGVLKDCTPSVRRFKADKAKAVLSLGGIFFTCQILYMLIANSNEFFISHYTSAEYVVEYQVYNRLFSLGSTLFMLALTPVWSAVSKAIAEKDFLWMKQLNSRLIKLSWIAAAAEFLIIPFLPLLVKLWLGTEAISVNYAYAFCFALFGSSMIFQNTASIMANGMGRMKIQTGCYTVGVFIKFLLVHIGIVKTQEWIIVVLANAIILIPYIIIQQLETRRYIDRQIAQLG